MRFLGYTIGDDSTPLPAPTPELFAEMGEFMAEAVNAGVLVATGGLAPSSEGTTIRLADGRFSITDGPYTEAKELIGGWALLEAPPRRRRSNGRSASSRSTAAARRASARSSGRRTSVPPASSVHDVDRAIEAVWRIESARLIAGLARVVGDVGLAEDLAQDALVAALQQWPESGVPDNPGAWLMAVGRRRAIDLLRRRAILAQKQGDRARARGRAGPRPGRARLGIEDDIGDDLLRLVFVACHPVLSKDARVALTLRLVGGLTTDEIARAFLVSGGDRRPADRPRQADPGRGARAVRGSARRHELAPRLASVLEVVYLIFNEGYSATGGDDWTRPGLCEEALRLGGSSPSSHRGSRRSTASLP